jgi:single-strand DNA-binding protein
MAKSVNKVILVGNLGKDPELRSTPQGKSVCSFSIATSERFLDKASNEWKENTEWHNVVLWERQADVAAQYLKKGSKVYIEGMLKHRSYEGKDGVTRYITEVLCRELVLLDRPEGGSSYSGGGSNSGSGYSSSKSYDSPNTPVPDFPIDSTDDDEVPF